MCVPWRPLFLDLKPIQLVYIDKIQVKCVGRVTWQSDLVRRGDRKEFFLESTDKAHEYTNAKRVW